MPRVTHVKSARKDNNVCKKGQSYYWWKFRFGGKHLSLTYPRPSQLTQSAYFGALYDLIDLINEHEMEPGNDGDIESLRDDVYSQLEEIQSECQESLDNMPESLQYAPTGELLQERIDACDGAMSELDSFDEPDQWSDVRDQMEEHDDWEENEPERADYPGDDEDEDDDGEEDFKVAKLEWLEDEPDIDDFEEAEKDVLTEAVENCIV